MDNSDSDSLPAIIIPGTPLVVPELVGVPGDRAADELRAAVLEAGRWLGERAATWRVRYHASALPDADVFTAGDAGTFAGFGADVVVTSSSDSNTGSPRRNWPLPLLVAAWVRERAAPTARILDTGPAAGTVFVLDGPNTLSERAPGGHVPADIARFDVHVSAVCDQPSVVDPATLDLPGWDRAARTLAGSTVRTLYQSAPFGVGYLVATSARRSA